MIVCLKEKINKKKFIDRVIKDGDSYHPVSPEIIDLFQGPRDHYRYFFSYLNMHFIAIKTVLNSGDFKFDIFWDGTTTHVLECLEVLEEMGALKIIEKNKNENNIAVYWTCIITKTLKQALKERKKRSSGS